MMTTWADWSGAFKRVAVTVAVLAGLLLLEGQLGPLTFTLRRVVGAALLGVVAVAAGSRRGSLTATITAWLAIAAIALAPTVNLALLAFVFGVAVLGLRRSDSSCPLAPGVAQATLSYVLVKFFLELVPQSRVLDAHISGVARSYLNFTLSGDHHLSPTALSVPAIGLLVMFLLWRWRLSGARIRLWGAVLLPVLWFLLLPVSMGLGASEPIGIFSRAAAQGLFWILCAAAIDAFSSSTRNSTEAATPARPRLGLIGGGIAALGIGITLVGGIHLGNAPNQSVLVHNRGGLDWERPVFGKFGAFSGGMFGLFPVYTRANGYQFEVLDRDSIEPDDLSGIQTLVLINSAKQWQGEELQTIRDFVARGGALLVLGDHTDVFGLMKGFNSLLEGFGIQFQFDSAYHARSTWRGCLTSSADAVTWNWQAKNPGVAVGASLELAGWSRPLLSGRYAHSDTGYRDNLVGSFLGNYAYEPGEKLGDTVLVALATHGRGRVCVFGDTSPFQGSFSHTYPLTVGPILNLLSRQTNWFELPFIRGLAGILCLSVLIVLWGRGSDSVSSAALASMLLAAIAGSTLVNHSALASPIAIDQDCFFIDDSHLPAVGHYKARVNPSGALDTTLLRCGLRVVHMDRWEAATLSKSRGIAFIAPQRNFTPGEIKDLLRFEQNGGITVLAVGHPDSAASESLLAAHDLALVARPLGTVPRAGKRGRREQDLPRFLDAWPIVSSSGKDVATLPGVDVIYRAEQDVTALFRSHGKGGLLLFSDSRFFSSMNTEDMSGHWIGNLALMHDVFRKYLGVDPDSVRPIFPSPKKPE